MDSIKAILSKSFIKIVLVILEILLVMSLIGVTTGYHEVLEKQEIQMSLEQEPQNVKTYNNSNLTDVNYSTGMNELIQCYRKNNDNLDDKIQEKIRELNSLYHQSSLYHSFLYQDIYSGFTVSYNEDTPIFTASTIKAPAMIYLMEKASSGEINLDESLTYTSNFYSGGSGVLKNKVQNTSYQVRTLIKYAITESDNIAYNMLMTRYGKDNVLNFWSPKGTKYIFTLDTIWGVTSAHDASIYMNELYNFYLNNDTYGKELMDYFKGATWKLITGKNKEFDIANKGGWSGSAIHDVAIVFDRNPYILIIMSNTGNSDYMTLFNKTSKIISELHQLYWIQKERECSSIKQY